MMAAASSNSASTTTVASERTGSAASLGEHRKLAQRLLMDLLIFMLLVIPIPIFEFGIEPFQRGFFCDDDTIRYPFRGNTVTPLLLGLLVGLMPALAFIVIEFMRFYRRGQMDDAMFVLGWKTPTWLIGCAQQMAYYVIGLVLTFDATEVGKYTIGRLRPHFIAVCQPQLADGSTCEDGKNQHRYIEDYTCRASGYTALDVLEARRSFPSGHTSLAFYAMLYMAFYIQQRLYWRRYKLSRHFVQFAALMLAWFTALSRIMDNWHHWSDVLIGALIGVMGALLTVRFIAKLHRKRSLIDGVRDSERVTSLKISIPRQDTSATLDEVISTPPPYMLNTSNSFSNEQYCTKV